MAISHADDVPGFTALRPDKDHKPAVEPSRGDEASFPVGEARVFTGRHPPAKTFAASAKSMPRSASVFSRFAGVKEIFKLLFVTPNNLGVQH